ncbi:hypothetical protein SAY87_021338 [Trapa incisa]|uniref:Uncharacterized protein n=1 Tax=Trapa incisa TaxID=236973 RepID=A0AAN7PVU5_9MYRT|nr:hypothetical protein SAY87_021338 [Trapa incisa]
MNSELRAPPSFIANSSTLTSSLPVKTGQPLVCLTADVSDKFLYGEDGFSLRFSGSTVVCKFPGMTETIGHINSGCSAAVCLFSDINHHKSLLFNEDPSLGNEGFCSIFNTESPIQGFSGVSELGCARSLLSSSQSHKSYGPTSAIPIEPFLSEFIIDQVSDNPPLNGEFSRFVSSKGGNKAGPTLVSHSVSVGPDFSYKILQRSVFSNTIDLLQLSSKLQQVDQERQFLKLEFDSF